MNLRGCQEQALLSTRPTGPNGGCFWSLNTSPKSARPLSYDCREKTIAFNMPALRKKEAIKA